MHVFTRVFVIHPKGVLFKRRPTNMMASAIAGAGWKTRHCTLVGTLFSWAESESSETLGYCEMLGAEVRCHTTDE